MFRFLKAASAQVWARGAAATGGLVLFMAVSAAATFQLPPGHGLALLPNGQLAGWGANDFAQVQAGQLDFLTTPVRFALPGTKAVLLAAGSRHSLAVDDAGKVWAWGDNSSGQLGIGHTRPVAGPTVVSGLPGRALLVAAGMQHSAALLIDGSVWVWGANNRGQLANGTVDAFGVTAKAVRVAALGRVLDLAAGDDFVVALVAQPAGLRHKNNKNDKNAKTGNKSSGEAGAKSSFGSSAKSGAVWAWGAGTAIPHPVEGLADAVVVRAADGVAMARTGSGGYWRWRVEQTRPAFAQRQAFDRLGEMTHPMLAALIAQVGAETNPRPADGAIAGLTNAATVTATVPTPAKPDVSAPAPATPTGTASTPLPASVLASTSAPNNTTAAAAAAAAATATATEVLLPAPSSKVSLGGTVRLSSGFGGDGPGAPGAPIENVQVSAEGAQCSPTDSRGRYTCSAPAGWSGRVSLRRANYRFSPSALSFRNLRVDAGQQDFAAIYDPR